MAGMVSVPLSDLQSRAEGARASSASERLFDFDKALQLADARGVPHFSQGLGFDLTDAFAGDFKLLADFLESARIAIAQAEAQFQDLAFAFGEAAEHVAQLVLEQAVAGHLRGVISRLVLDEIAEVRLLTVAHW